MKKSSLMGASVVAAALLAAAPVVAPVASLATPGTQVVKADDDQSDKAYLASFVNKLVDTLKGSSITSSTVLPTLTDSSFTAPTSSKVVYNNNNTGFTDDTQSGIYATAVESFNKSYIQPSGGVKLDSANNSGEISALPNLQYTLQYNVKYDNGTHGQLFSSNEILDAVKDLRTIGGTLTATYTFYDGHDNSVIKSVSPVVTFKPAAESTAGAFVTVNNINVSSDTPVSYLKSIGSLFDNGGQILNEKGESIVSSLTSDKVVLGDIVDSLDNAVSTTNPLKEGTYRQNVTFHLNKIFKNSETAEAAGKADRISFNGHLLNEIKNNNVANINYNGTTNDVTVSRLINVDKSSNVTDAPYTAEKLDGVVTVTTKEGTAAQVYDQTGNPVYSRALAPGSRWVTGQKRTLLKNGKVYYQVSTNEFLSADDVSYTANSASSSEHLKGAVKVTQIGKKVFTVADGNYGYVWAKDDDNNGMHLVKSRFLAPNSKWQSGAKANMTDSDGNTHEFYQVSTNEWIDGSVGSIN